MTVTQELVLIFKVLGGSAMAGLSILFLAHAVGKVDIDLQTLFLGPGMLVALASIILKTKLDY
ncbi:MAG: hypothetical protein WC802_01805 [Patescibacteria group bacterium]|jgi:hypothetical protein